LLVQNSTNSRLFFIKTTKYIHFFKLSLRVTCIGFICITKLLITTIIIFTFLKSQLRFQSVLISQGLNYIVWLIFYYWFPSMLEHDSKFLKLSKIENKQGIQILRYPLLAFVPMIV
jgi:hypothetical protein